MPHTYSCKKCLYQENMEAEPSVLTAQKVNLVAINQVPLKTL